MVWGRWRPPVSWFPGHMAKAKKQMQDAIKRCDLVIEVRDARVPLSSASESLDALIDNKPRLVLYNKVDLADPKACAALMARHAEEGRRAESKNRDGGGGGGGRSTRAMALSATKGRGLKQVLRWLQSEAKGKFKTAGALVMVCGVPNVGKSTIINSLGGMGLKGGGRAPVGPLDS